MSTTVQEYFRLFRKRVANITRATYTMLEEENPFFNPRESLLLQGPSKVAPQKKPFSKYGDIPSLSSIPKRGENRLGWFGRLLCSASSFPSWHDVLRSRLLRKKEMAEADLHLPQTENVASQIKDLFAIRREEQAKWDPDAIKRGGGD